MRKTLSWLVFLAVWPLGVMAEEPAENEPDIEIRYGKKETTYEYRVNGELVEIKVVPKVGPVYYLVPAADGSFERSETSRILVPSWKLLEW